MGNEAAKIRAALRQLTGKKENIFIATVTDLDNTNMTIDCQPLDGSAEIKGVRLVGDKAGAKFVLFPQVGSDVVVIEDMTGDAHLLLVSDVEEIWLNGNGFDGLVRVGELVTKLNALENKVNDLITTFNTHVHSGVVVGVGSSAVPTGLVVGTLTPTQQSEIENTSVKHGN